MYLYLTARAIQEEKIRQARKESELQSLMPSLLAEWMSYLRERRHWGITKALKGSSAVVPLADEK